MTADLEASAPKNSHCLFCNSKLGVSSRNSCDIFSNKNLLSNEERALSAIIGEVLQIEVTKESVHSCIICKKCFKLFFELDEIETRMSEIKFELTTNYQKTLKLISGEPEEVVEELEENKLPLASEAGNIIKPVSKRGRKKGTIMKKKPLSSQESEEEEAKENDEVFDEDEIIMDNDDSEYIPEGYNRGAGKVRIKSEQYEDDEEDEDFEDDDENRGRRGRKKLIKNEIPSDLPEKWVEKIENDYTCLLCPEPDPQETTTITISQYNHDPDSVETEQQTQTLEHEKCIFDIKSIVTHMKNEHDLRLYVCDVCGEDFRKRTQLSLHLDEHVANEEGDFQCEVCNRIFTNLRLFRIHKRMHYPPSKLWTCETCGKRYNSRNLLEEHMNTHTGIRPYECKTCGKDFASKYTFRAHCKTHEVRPRPFPCSSCGKSFLSAQNLTQHERTHSGLRNFVCDQCGKAFGTARNLEVHSVVHSGYKPFMCRMCGKAFARKAEIRDHERTHTGEKPYQCEFCGSTFSQRSNLQSHKRATHYQDKRYKCQDCGKGFKRRRLLDYHIKAVHTGERPYKCTVCSSTFVYPEHFKKHRRIHTGEKPFHCEVCNKAFNSRDNRNAHRFVHSDKKPYECLVCGMGFMRKPLLYNHMETQGHLNDTIVVNQPRLPTEEDLMADAEVVEMVTANSGEVEMIVENNGHEEETKLYIAGLKEPVIIRQGDDLKANGQELDHETVEHLIIDGQVHFTDGTDIGSIHEEIQHVTEEYDEENNRHTLIVPATRNILGQEIEIEETTEDGSAIDPLGPEIATLEDGHEVHEDGPVHLVHIRIPGNAQDPEAKTWFTTS